MCVCDRGTGVRAEEIRALTVTQLLPEGSGHDCSCVYAERVNAYVEHIVSNIMPAESRFKLAKN